MSFDKTAGETENDNEDKHINDPTDRDFDATLTQSRRRMTSAFTAALNSVTSFGTGVVRPTVEGDFFYNGFRGGVSFHPEGSFW